MLLTVLIIGGIRDNMLLAVRNVMDLDREIDWNNVKILKSESYVYRRRTAKSLLINQKSRSLHVINRKEGANFPAVCSAFSLE